MNLPSAKKPSKPTTPPKINRIVIDVDGHITLNGQKMEFPTLKESLFAMKASDPETSVVVKGAGDVDYQGVIRVLDLLQQADITKVGLATETTQ
jgi:biopolymer transport protein ExbD